MYITFHKASQIGLAAFQCSVAPQGWWPVFGPCQLVGPGMALWWKHSRISKQCLTLQPVMIGDWASDSRWASTCLAIKWDSDASWVLVPFLWGAVPSRAVGGHASTGPHRTCVVVPRTCFPPPSLEAVHIPEGLSPVLLCSGSTVHQCHAFPPFIC